MNSLSLAVFFILIGAMVTNAAEPAKLPEKQKLRIYLSMGQSNMAGRGAIEKADKTPHARVLMFVETNGGSWVPAVEPITKDDNKTHGVGPALAFAKAMAEKDPSVTIGLVATAEGGTPLKRWEKGADLYERAVHRAKLAIKDGTLAGVIWHQGESNTGDKDRSDNYGERLAKMINDLRTDLNAPDLPFVVGELGEFLINRKKHPPIPRTEEVNRALRDLPKHVAHTGFVSAHGLTDKGDELHFDSKSQREFGRRYADVMSKLQTAR
ncbi:MAG: sialate O-acetylesterase [Limisphaerales bacterium]